MPCGMRGGGTAVPLSFISHGRDVAGRRAPRSPALPLAFHPTLPGGGFQPGPPLSAGYASGYFPRSSRYLVFHTVSVYYHTPGKVSREGVDFCAGAAGWELWYNVPGLGMAGGRRPGSPAAAGHGGALGLGTRPNRRKTCRKKGREPSGARSLRAVPLFFRHLPRGGKSGTMERINRQHSTKFDTGGSHSQERRGEIWHA